VEDEDWTVRRAAVQKLRTPLEVWMKLTNSLEHCRKEEKLAEEVVESKDRSVRKAAVAKLVETRIEVQSKVGENP
jgi:hypothetical protein